MALVGHSTRPISPPMDDKENHLARSQSVALLQEEAQATATAAAAVAIGGRKQSDPFAQQVTGLGFSSTALTPIHEAQSYRLNSTVGGQHGDDLPQQALKNNNQVKRLTENWLLEPEQANTPSRHSAASLKVHFRSIDDVSGHGDRAESAPHPTSQPTANHGSTTDASIDEIHRRRTCSEATSWTASESDINGHAAGVGDDEEATDGEGFVAPDGGWGWVVVAASFVVNLMADGVTFSFGIVNTRLRDHFQESYGYTAWIYGLFMAIPLLSGPLASSLTDRYGCRRVTIGGSILAALGFILSSFSDSLELLFFTVGIVSGFGLSLCYVAAIVIVAYYFEKKRSLATGLAVCGSGIGNFIMAPITQYLIDEYGWRGTLLIVAGFFLNMSVCGALMRDIEGTGRRSKRDGRRSRQWSESQFCPTPDRLAEEFATEGQPNADGGIDFLAGPGPAKYSDLGHLESDGAEGNEGDVRLCHSLINLPTFLVDGRDKIPREVLMTIPNNPLLYSIVLDNYPTLFDDCLVQSGTIATAASGSAQVRDAQEDKNRLNGKGQAVDTVAPLISRSSATHTHHWKAAYLRGLRVKKRSLTYRGAMLNLPRYRLRASSCPDLYRNSITTIAREKEGAFWDYLQELREVLGDIFDSSYLANARFVMFFISNILLYSCYHVPYGYIADWAIAQGHSEENAPFLLSIVGILNTFGVVILGYVGDRSWADATWIYSGSMLVCGLSTAAVPLLSTYAGLAAASGLFGLSIAANYTLAAVILVDLISLERFVNAYGLLLMFQGVANLVGPPLAGWICDLTGSYTTSFYIAGAFIVLSGVILVMQHVQIHLNSRAASAASLEAGNHKEALDSIAARSTLQSPKTISTAT